MTVMKSCSGMFWRLGPWGIGLWLWAGGGCAGAWPAMFPVGPVRTAERPGGDLERWYDVDGNGRAEYLEVLAPGGRFDRIGYDRDEDGRLDEEIALGEVPPGEIRHLLIILDSVPAGMVRDMQAQGRLRYFGGPADVLSPFPVMTDPALGEFFGMVPVPAVESAYYDGGRLRDGYEVYASDGNAPWHAKTHYHLSAVAHAVAYLSQPEWLGHELRRTKELFESRSQQGQVMTVSYLVSPSALGSLKGRSGHVLGLVALDRFCQRLVYESRGRARISLMSDHGHNLVPSERIPLAADLARLGYRVGAVLERPGDVVVPEFGVVSCAALYTREPARVAGDAVHLRGIELAVYREPGAGGLGAVVVLDRTGRARITRSDAGYQYTAEAGDPLRMIPVREELRRRGQVDPEGFVADGVLFEATVRHVYPDGVARLWRAFDGLFVHEPDVLLSVAEGFEVGSRLMTTLVHMQATHGNLRGPSSTGFAASMSGDLPPVLRMRDLRGALRRLGVPIAD